MRDDQPHVFALLMLPLLAITGIGLLAGNFSFSGYRPPDLLDCGTSLAGFGDKMTFEWVQSV